MVIKPEVIKIRLRKLEEVIKLLGKYREYSKEEFRKNATVNGAAKYNIILGIEIIADIGNHILSEVYGAQPDEYRDIIEMLGEYEIVSEKLAKENADMAGFRNLLVHDYMKVISEKVYNNLQKAPDVFRQFAKYFVKFLEKQK